ncbi:protein phosphatase 1 regulatory subunit 7 isoform X1 [Mustela putorius furo]|uniref:Protein phosphatase 1 regulatory subunit 7 isoform X1 n=2 Tax=Mustela putorius furo TaxID=9669 RepID=A0A8U0MVY5_MUSPF|nr:protein phosphatase 1 regulatory subunit 7 isoform X1 [Mustela putorius furo]
MYQQDMSESSSGRNSSSQIFPSSSSYCSGPSESHTWSALSRNRTLHPHSDSGISSPLPSDSCKYLTWHKVEQHDIQGSQLRCPRVREGPSTEELLFRQEECTRPAGKRVLEKNKWETWLQENWEDCTNLNLSFQDLGDPYQVANFNRILRRLIRVETLWLVDNSLVDLSATKLPRCRVLNMNKNHLTSFKQLPKIPQIQHLSLAENHIESLTGLSSLCCTPLESLTLKRNPCEFHQNYRKRVFSCLPNLKMLDGIPKLPEDSSPPEANMFSKMCIIS